MIEEMLEFCKGCQGHHLLNGGIELFDCEKLGAWATRIRFTSSWVIYFGYGREALHRNLEFLKELGTTTIKGTVS